MNIKRILFAGLVTGFILNIPDGMVGAIVMSPKWAALAQPSAMTGGRLAPIYFILLNFVYGILVIFAYAALRSHFAGGPKLALYPALFMWVVVQLTDFGHVLFGNETFQVFILMAAVWLIGISVGAILGGRLYKEQS